MSSDILILFQSIKQIKKYKLRKVFHFNYVLLPFYLIIERQCMFLSN